MLEEISGGLVWKRMGTQESGILKNSLVVLFEWAHGQIPYGCGGRFLVSGVGVVGVEVCNERFGRAGRGD